MTRKEDVTDQTRIRINRIKSSIRNIKMETFKLNSDKNFFIEGTEILQVKKKDRDSCTSYVNLENLRDRRLQ